MPFMETYSTWSSQGIFYTDSWNDDTITFLPDGQEVRELPPKPITLLLHGLGSSSLIKLIDELGFKEKIIVVGHSIGTIIASNLAAEYPDRIGGVVLLGALNPCKGLAAILDGRIKAITELGKGLIDLASSLPRITTSRKSTPLERAYVLSSILSMDPNEYVRLSKAITNSKKPRYFVIKASLLILAGEDDMNVSSEEILEAYGTAKHKKKLEWLKDCGHWICVEKGDVVAISLLILFKNRAANTSSSLDPFTSSRRSLA
ncbi:hypothetical protein BCIN_11g05450 [Botrytis cinerea B05.10]|uniref:AB hydrolase-1 domain-containing protein n=2 Tax=Botryotinia fuckeliana TaxID=40559 RepID=A0A384JY39_BOTFB|nr:hypothetical protein BCIN_11g05450 [Botrytis cinerea B05.10]ATZ55274.1 hypothetical protein BCIN_11g05450 [Botrytis cinerea B05.10]